ncbi:Murein hydrolase activator NlpD [termite gut metagenome]|uniref:Murein hydrolase activator NlpD n=1 Tax=termite gut metagenome TaxID=433724 RepID=A0A5J4SVV3_9ZZZZ
MNVFLCETQILTRMEADMKLDYPRKVGMLIAVLITLSLNSFAQDLIARQAPIDKTFKKIDSLVLQKLIISESISSSLVSDLYPHWNNSHNKTFSSPIDIPEKYSIDLSDFSMPTASKHITSSFGPRKGRMHYGIDIKVYTGDTIVAAFGGKVRIVNSERRGYGNYIVIRHNNGLETLYAHLSKQLVNENQEVKAGEAIGLGGNTGRSTGSHLHFETRFLGVAINPAKIFDFRQQYLVADRYVFTKSKISTQKDSHSTRINIKENAYTAKAETNTNNNIVKSNSNNNSEDFNQYHMVKRGDNLTRIAKTKATSISQLCKLNGITAKTILQPGQILRYS